MAEGISVVAIGHHLWSDLGRQEGDLAVLSALGDRLGGACAVVVVGPDRRTESISRHGLTIVRIPSRAGRIGFLALATVRARRVLRSWRGPRVVLSSDILGGLVGLVLRRLTGARLVFQLQGGVLVPGPEYGSRLKRRVMAATARMVSRRADGVRCLNKELERQVNALSPKGRTRVIGTRVDTARFTPEGPEGGNAGENGGGVVVSVASLHPAKNLGFLIRAFAAIVEGHEAARLILVGDGPERARLGSLAEELGITDRVSFLGTIPHEEIPDILRGASVFAMPSLSEGQPRAALEAHAAGLPVVGSNIPGLEGVVLDGETGFLLPLGDERAWSDAISKLLDDEPLRRRMGSEARRHVVARYDFASAMDNLAEFVGEIAGRPRNGRGEPA